MNTMRAKDFNHKFKDMVSENNKRLSQSLYMSFNRRVSLRNNNVCYIGSYVDFENFVKSNLQRANMNLLITDSDLFWYSRLQNELRQLEYTLTIVRDHNPIDMKIFHQTKQAVFVQVAREDVLSTLYAHWIEELKEQNHPLPTPLMFIPDVTLPNMIEQMLCLSKHNVHLTLHGEDISTIKGVKPQKDDIVLANCDTLIVSDMNHLETAQYVQNRVTAARDCAHLTFAENRDTTVFNTNSVKTEHARKLSLKDNQCLVCVTAALPVLDKKL